MQNQIILSQEIAKLNWRKNKKDKDFYKLVTQKLAEKLGCETQDIYIVWQCKTLQNIKGAFSSDVHAANGMYY